MLNLIFVRRFNKLMFTNIREYIKIFVFVICKHSFYGSLNQTNMPSTDVQINDD